MSQSSREKARERGQKSGKGTRTLSRFLAWARNDSNGDTDENTDGHFDREADFATLAGLGVGICLGALATQVAPFELLTVGGTFLAAAAIISSGFYRRL